MSRIGKQIVIIPAGVTATIDKSFFTVTGPKGNLERDFKTDLIGIVINGNEITFTLNKITIESRALWGTVASHVKNMVVGVTDGFTKKLILEGVGFKSEIKNGKLELALGFSHPVSMPIPDGLTATAEKNVITVSGFDKELVGSFTAKVRGMKKPEPYKGKGFRYDNEIIRRKQGKKSA
ncbi:50S ribosomal protein L6 [Candidatus Nomurabacteria bacterium RIFCSPHIGHO2_02_FULL_33_12]|uniref:50S ribosomal protein L6 n=1 Tax=Candidatus Nomurabacteria bacterium RIFCSPLOWO2_01_FULL_33_17 TaxID=1801764 RepID=A0A1F6WPM6_9BACT|nr:MAG: 50S ribosomal protein L6 [Candidatus Nomurabacteria bacterium RIFCSPHIGHO2_02_FULL_33_12]OGI83838.1 MAG: 50S ribosomal protein L6 [Candidatus Nomurabacteria bacterium RIFCSPLOWO2_01_FULL_33_17]